MEGNRKDYHATILNRKRVFSMYLDALSDSLSRLCGETGLTYEAASRHCRCSSQYFSAIIRRKSVPSIAVLENLATASAKRPTASFRYPTTCKRNPIARPCGLRRFAPSAGETTSARFPYVRVASPRWSGSIRLSATVADSGCRGEASVRPRFLCRLPKRAGFFSEKPATRFGIRPLMW